MEPNYSRWLKKRRWSAYEAALLLYGEEPDGWMGETLGSFKSKLFENRADIEHFVQTLADFISTGLREFNRSGGFCSRRILQWAYIVRSHFNFDEYWSNYFSEHVVEMNQGYAWYDDGYEKFLHKQSWSAFDIMNILSQCPSKLRQLSLAL